MSLSNNHRPIIFFDGYCMLCNKSINWIIKRDKKKVFQFASLQGETAKKHLADKIAQIDSVVLFQEPRAYTHFSAVGLICKQLPFPYSIGRISYFLPQFMYNWIAKNRYDWFGKRDTCRVPNNEEKERFLP